MSAILIGIYIVGNSCLAEDISVIFYSEEECVFMTYLCLSTYYVIGALLRAIFSFLILTSRKPPAVHIRYYKTVFLAKCLMKTFTGEK